ncbi:transcriptional regulator, XRE family protein, partial [Amycolatopsis rhizosphaerae]
VVGQPGVGKTALAVAAVHELRPLFPDGCLAVDLRGVDDQPVAARVVLDRLLRSLGVPGPQVPVTEAERSSLFRMLLDGRRVLLLLDNAADEAQVRPLLAHSPGCLTLVTCRRTLAGLEGARWLRLAPLAEGDAVRLLMRIAGEDRVAGESRAAAELVGLCGNLPLAVRIVGNRLATRSHWSLAYSAGQLRDERTRLGSLSAGDLQVRSAFEVSYQRLSPGARRVFRRLAVVPGSDFGAELAGVAHHAAEAAVLPQLDELVEANLLNAAAVPGRFEFHDLIRLFARERWEAEDGPEERSAVRDTLLVHLLRTATTAAAALSPLTREAGRFPSADKATAWLTQEQSNWVAAQRKAAALGLHQEVVTLAKTLSWPFWLRDRLQERPWSDIFGHGVASARALDSRLDLAVLLNLLGQAQLDHLGVPEDALATHAEALAVARAAGHRAEEAWAHTCLSTVLDSLGRLDEALEHARQGCAIAAGLGSWITDAASTSRLGQALRALGRYEEALAVHRDLLRQTDGHHEELGPEMSRLAAVAFLSDIAHCLAGLGQWREAAETFREARSWHVAGGDSFQEAETALYEGVAWREVGEFERARDCLRLALGVFSGPVFADRRARAEAELASLPEQWR